LAAADIDEQYEGRLSDFDVRGLVPRPRPRQLEIEHTLPTGEQCIAVFRDGLARLAAYEIDYLDGSTGSSCTGRPPANLMPPLG